MIHAVEFFNVLHVSSWPGFRQTLVYALRAPLTRLLRIHDHKESKNVRDTRIGIVSGRAIIGLSTLFVIPHSSFSSSGWDTARTSTDSHSTDEQRKEGGAPLPLFAFLSGIPLRLWLIPTAILSPRRR